MTDIYWMRFEVHGMAKPKTCWVLGIDLAAYSDNVVESQLRDFERLTRICLSKVAVVRRAHPQVPRPIKLPTGDGMFVILTDATGAIALRLLEDIYQALKDEQLEATFAIHTGENHVVDHDVRGSENVVGHGINTCARILHAAAPGQVLLSDGFVRQIDEKEIWPSGAPLPVEVRGKRSQRFSAYNYHRGNVGIANGGPARGAGDLDYHPLITALRKLHADLLFINDMIAERQPKLRLSLLCYDPGRELLVVTRFRIEEWRVIEPSPTTFKPGVGIAGVAFLEPRRRKEGEVAQKSLYYLPNWDSKAPVAQERYISFLLDKKKKLNLTREEIVSWRRHARAYLSIPLFGDDDKAWAVLAIDSMEPLGFANEHEKGSLNEETHRALWLVSRHIEHEFAPADLLEEVRT